MTTIKSATKFKTALLFLFLEFALPLPAFYLIAGGVVPPVFHLGLLYAEPRLSLLSIGQFVLLSIGVFYFSAWLRKVTTTVSVPLFFRLLLCVLIVTLTFIVRVYRPVCHGTCGWVNLLGLWQHMPK